MYRPVQVSEKVKQYVAGAEIPAEWLAEMRDDDHRERYRRGFEIPADMMNVLMKRDFGIRYANGFDVPEEKVWTLLYDDYRERYRRGFEIPESHTAVLTAGDCAAGYAIGQPVPQDKLGEIWSIRFNDDRRINSTHREYQLCEPAHRRACYIGGHKIPDIDLPFMTKDDRLKRCANGFDPDLHDLRLSHLLGYKMPAGVTIKASARELAFSRNPEANKVSRCIVTGRPYLVSHDLVDEIEHFMKIKVPRFIEFRDLSGEVVFRCDKIDDLEVVKNVKVDQLCDELYSPDWGECFVGRVFGEIKLVPRPRQVAE